MFGLIIAVVSIALIILVIGVTGHFGGDVFSKGSEEVSVAHAMNDLGQIRSAVATYTAQEGSEPVSLQVLVPTYLRTIPEGWGIEGEGLSGLTVFESTRLKRSTEADELTACKEVNRRMGLTDAEPPACDNLPKNFYGCCVAP